MKKVMVIFLLALSACDQSPNQQGLAVNIDTLSVVDANGELASSDNAVLGPPAIKSMWQYKITFLAAEGVEVKPGDPVVSFDPSKLRQTLSVKSIALRTARKTLENTQLTNEATLEKQKLQLAEQIMKNEKAKRKWQQSKGLESNIQSKTLEIEYLLASNEVKRLQRTLQKRVKSNNINLSISRNTVLRLESEVNQMKSDVKRLTVVAPKPGIVIYRADHQGNKVSSGDTVWMGRQVISLPSLNKMMVKATILEADAGKVRVGQAVDVSLDAAPDRIFKGVVDSLGQVFRRKNPKQPNIVFDAEIRLLEIDAELMRPGMATRIKIYSKMSSSLEKNSNANKEGGK